MLTLRDYTGSEEEVLLAMMERFCREGDFDFHFPTRLENLRYFTAHAASGQTWLIEVDGRPAGYVIVTFGFSFEFGGRDSFIDEIYLEPQVRRRGLGRATIEKVQEELQKMEIKQLHLEADLDNHTLKPFYESCGFVERGYRLFSKKLHP